MKPGADRVLQVLAQTLLAEHAPHVRDDYAQRNLMLVSMLLAAAAEQWDRAAAWRVEENAALRELFGAARGCVRSQALARRLEAAAASREPGLGIAELDRANAELRGLLVELHAHVEELDGAGARRLEDRIWEELRRSTERRRLGMQPF